MTEKKIVKRIEVPTEKYERWEKAFRVKTETNRQMADMYLDIINKTVEEEQKTWNDIALFLGFQSIYELHTQGFQVQFNQVGHLDLYQNDEEEPSQS